MTLASWFSSLKHSRRRQAQNGGRRNRSHKFDRSAFLEALEDRLVLSSVSFSTGSETVNASAGTFSVPVTLSGSRTPTVSTFASGFDSAAGMAFDSAGNLYVANFAGDTVSKVTPTGVVSTFATGFNRPSALAFDAGNLYVANEYAGTVSKVTPAGVVSTFASGLDWPDALAFDAGNLYVANYLNVGNDLGNTVSEVTPAGVVSTFASGFDGPEGLAFDSAGNLYVANGLVNVLSDTVSKVTPAGLVSTFAGGFLGPASLAFDSVGNLYVANEFNSTTVSKVTPAGVVSTFVSGLSGPDALAFHAGNLYVDSGNTVSKVSETVTVPFTLGGTGVSGTAYSGVTASPLTFGIGQTTEYITGKLLSDPGPSPTLTFTLGTPTAGAALGSPSVNTLTITEPPVAQFSAGSETVNASAGTFKIAVTLSSEDATGSVNVPFTLGGTATAGVAYSSVSASPLVFPAGTTTEYITGTLLSDPGPSRTLTFTLGTPTAGAALASPSVNTLTITEPTLTPAPVPPVFVSEHRVFSGRGKHRRLVGFEFLFNGALNAADAQLTGNYRVTQKNGKKVKTLPVSSASYSDNTVTITVGGFESNKAGQVKIVGLVGADGAALSRIMSGL